MSTKQIAVTGASGFVGKNLVPYLTERSIGIYSVVRNGSDLTERSVPFRLFDTSYIDQHGITAIVHLAGKAHDLKNVSDASEYFQVNTELTKKIFNAFVHSAATLFIYISSVKAVTDNTTEPVTEETIAHPQTIYGQSKRAAEEYLLSQEIPFGKRCIILRPCMIHGPGNKGNLNSLYQFIAKGIPYPLGAFENRRSFLGIDNFCYVINAILNTPFLATGIYNIADDQALSTNELIKEMGEARGKKPLILPINRSFVRGVARLGNKLHFPFNSDRLGKLTQNFIVSNVKIITALNIKLPVSAIDGIRKTIRSFVAHK